MSNISYRKTRKLIESLTGKIELITGNIESLSEKISALREAHAEDYRIQKEKSAELERLHDKSKKENDEAWQKLRQDFERFGISQGEQIEAMFVDLGTKFNELGFDFPKEAEGRVRFLGENRKVLAEVDKLLENGEVMMAVEVKSKLKQDNVDDHIRRLGIISDYNKKHNDSRKVLGAVAGGIVADNVLVYAQGMGLYVLVRNGKSVDIAALPANFKPKEWKTDFFSHGDDIENEREKRLKKMPKMYARR